MSRSIFLVKQVEELNDVFFYHGLFFLGERNSRDFLVAVFLHSAMYLGGVLKC